MRDVEDLSLMEWGLLRGSWTWFAVTRRKVAVRRVAARRRLVHCRSGPGNCLLVPMTHSQRCRALKVGSQAPGGSFSGGFGCPKLASSCPGPVAGCVPVRRNPPRDGQPPNDEQIIGGRDIPSHQQQTSKTGTPGTTSHAIARRHPK